LLTVKKTSKELGSRWGTGKEEENKGKNGVIIIERGGGKRSDNAIKGFMKEEGNGR